ncbi:MAG: hypothetical protein EOO63_14010 [Hymenobacter sp.]|nr:MAG: hypothetical protein EOO63_14010 [Hymenobacter sp.]
MILLLAPATAYLLEAGSTTALASKARALAVPPSQLTPDMRGAGPGSLAVEVLNTLGQRVCTGPACAEASSDCPVEGCPPARLLAPGRAAFLKYSARYLTRAMVHIANWLVRQKTWSRLAPATVATAYW